MIARQSDTNQRNVNLPSRPAASGLPSFVIEVLPTPLREPASVAQILIRFDAKQPLPDDVPRQVMAAITRAKNRALVADAMTTGTRAFWGGMVMISPVEKLLSRLDGVRETKRGAWQARCPAHGDKSPSLSIKETGDGTILLRCFAGCNAYEIVSVVGLELSDLFPRHENFTHRRPGTPLRRPWSAADVLRAVQHELHVVAVCAGQLRNEGLTLEDSTRLTLALQRVFAASAGVV